MKSEHKALSIISIWFAAFAIMAILFIGRDVTLGPGILAFMTLAGAIAGTIEMAQSAAPKETSQPGVKESEKAKNRANARVDKLLSDLSEDDLAALRRRLADNDSVRISDDGELVTLEQALRGRQ